MKVNIYDPENVQKGKLMLMNIAEDLKEYAKVKVSPTDQESKTPDAGNSKQDKTQKKPHKLDDIKKGAEKQRMSKNEITEIDDGDDDDDFEGKSNHIYMELQSTVAFREVDIDKMLEHTTLDDFLKGLYVNSLG